MNEDTLDNLKGGIRIFRNFGFLSAGKFFGDLFTFAFFIVLARAYGQEGVGEYSFAMALTGVLVVFADYGLFKMSVKDMSRQSDSISEYYGKLLAVRLILSSLVLGVMVLVIWFLPFSINMKLIILMIGCFQVFVTLMNSFGAVFIAREEMLITSSFELILKTVTALAGISIVFFGGGLVSAVTVLPLISFLMVGAAYLYTIRVLGRLSIRISLHEFRKILVDSFPYAMHVLLGMISSRVSLIFLGLLVGAAAAGIFNAAYRVVFVLLFIPVFSAWAIFPLASKLYVESSEGLRELFRKSLNLVVLAGLPMTAGLWLIAGDLIDLLYGLEFKNSMLVMQWLACIVLAGFLRIILEVFMTASDNQSDLTKYQLHTAIVSVVLHYLLIAGYGVYGATIATVITEFFLVILLGRHLSYLFDWRSLIERTCYATIGVLAFLVPLLVWDGLSLWIVIPASMMIYSAVLLLFSDIRKNEARVLRQYLANIHR